MASAIQLQFLLCAITCCGSTAPPCDAQVAVVRQALAGDSADASAAVVMRAEVDDDNGELKLAPNVMFFGSDDADDQVVREMPNVWIGVRVTPVPKPLASHLKREGLMIENVAKDSPADEAGLERYDVIVSLGGKNIANMNDLLDAVREAGAGNQVDMTVIRGGAVTDVRVTPTKRSEMGDVKFKYEEPEADDSGPLQKYFGHKLKIGPEGGAILMPHGQLVLPDDVKDLLRDLPDFQWRGDLDLDDLGNLHWNTKSGDEDNATGEIEISVSENGESITIHRSENGEISVDRVDADGNETSDVYGDEEELRNGDEKAYDLYRQFSEGRGHAIFMVKPDMKGLGLHQKRFEIELKDALNKAREAKGAAGKVRRRIEIHKGACDDNARVEKNTKAKTKTVTLRVEDDGRITIDINEDGVNKKYEFKDREEFKREEPDLYKEFGEQLEDSEGACGDAVHFAALS